MTEAEWLVSLEPQKMLELLRVRGGDRKLRLFAVECWRRIWSLVDDATNRADVELAERYADGQVTAEELELAHEATFAGADMGEQVAGYITTNPDAWGAAAASLADAGSEGVITCYDREPVCFLVRCIFGNPFRPVRIDPAWTAWNDGTVRRIAAGIYEERAFDRLPILADALLDAGCDDEQLLEHCRSEGPHARGCFAIDALLGKA